MDRPCGDDADGGTCIFAFADAAKRAVLADLGVALEGHELRVPVNADDLEPLLLAARVFCLSKEERYWLGAADELRAPLSFRNEAAAVSYLLARLPAAGAPRAALLRRSEAVWAALAGGGGAPPAPPPPPAFPPPGGPEAAFEAWAAEAGIRSALRVADFPGGPRGCAAAAALAPGDAALSVPLDAAVTPETVAATELGALLGKLPVDAESALIVFTMADRRDPASRWAPMWAALPRALRTGLSFPAPLAAALAGTAAGAELARARAHLAATYAALTPLLGALVAAYPGDFRPEWFSFPAYLWAAELWYSYAFEVEAEQASGETSSFAAMLPFACLCNHSAAPAVVRYGRAPAATRRLEFPAFRAVPRGEQVCISYGAVGNLKLVVYFGFALAGNPHDSVPLALGVRRRRGGEEQGQGQEGEQEEEEQEEEHALRAWGPLAPPLLACVRSACATAADRAAAAAGGGTPAAPLGAACERQALATLEAALAEVAAPLEASPLLAPGGRDAVLAAIAEGEGISTGAAAAEWGPSVDACIVYVEGQRAAARHSLAECRRLARAAELMT